MAWNAEEHLTRVIIADDDPVQRWLLRENLCQSGYEVIETADGQAAWDALQDGMAQVVVTNWMMPGIDGLDLIRQIRAARLDRYIYVILLTARNTKLDVVDGLEAGADDYLVKPFDPNELLARVSISKRILQLEASLRESRDHERMLARHDSLTGLFNRRAIYEHAEAELARADREDSPISLILLDIDHFKEVNDHHGHLIGDQTLYLIAATISRNKRPFDWFGRWGGEEFLMVLPNTNLQEACQVAERIRLSVGEVPLPLPGGRSFKRTISLGVTSARGTSLSSLDMLLQQADSMLLLAKERGRNQISVYHDSSNLLSNERNT
jgi:two-component system chemotaxis response regulator CheY